jgi:nickel-dependent lactate racemase
MSAKTEVKEAGPLPVIGRGLRGGFLSEDQVRTLAAQGLERLDVDGRRVLVLIPDGTRTMPMPLVFEILEKELARRTAALDFLVALGTHPPMDDARLSRHLGTAVVDGRAGRRRIYNHRWDDPGAFVALGEIPAREIAELTEGRMDQAAPVRLNRLILDYDHILICGPVFPHEVAGFSGGTKYFFPGIAGPEIIHLTHWLGALITSTEIIGTGNTAVRAVIDRAVRFVDRPHSLLALVAFPEGVAGLYCGPTRETWEAAAALSAQRHVVWVEKPFQRVLSIMPPIYDDLWTGAKGMYKMEPAVADGGEIVIYAPHIREVSYVHGRLIDEIGYHCRDYFLAQWDRFRHYPGGILAHSTHVKGQGMYDAAAGIESPRIRVTLATAIPEDRCRRVHLDYRDPAAIRPEKEDWRVVPRAGEMLYRVKKGASNV